MSQYTRRDFARSAGLATALSYSRILGANDRLRMGYIGLGNRGDQVHDAFLEHGDQQTVAVCDLRDDYMDFAIRKSRANPRKYSDYHKLLDDKEVDAVAIATPDHWHALMFVDACHAGKDVYVEKPLSLTVHEGRRMVEVARATSRARNFLDCVKSRARSNCDIEIGHRSTSATLIGNIAHKTRSFLEWDGRAERFTNNEAANRLLSYRYRAPYKLG